MNPLSALPPTTFVPLSFEQLAVSLSHPMRWRILAELSAGEPRMVVELARQLGAPATTISKHLAAMRRAGVVVIGRGRLYHIPRHFRPVPGQRVVDFGHAVLRLEVPAGEGA